MSDLGSSCGFSFNMQFQWTHPHGAAQAYCFTRHSVIGLATFLFSCIHRIRMERTSDRPWREHGCHWGNLNSAALVVPFTSPLRYDWIGSTGLAPTRAPVASPSHSRYAMTRGPMQGPTMAGRIFGWAPMLTSFDETVPVPCASRAMGYCYTFKEQ